MKQLTTTFSNLTESLTKDVNQAKSLFSHLSNVNVQDEMEKVNKSLSIARHISERVRNVTDEV